MDDVLSDKEMTMGISYSTLIVENDNLAREGLRLLLERTQFAPTTCSLGTDQSFSNYMPKEAPSILIIFGRERIDLLSLVAKFRERFAATRIVVLAHEGSIEVLATAMEAGANAILLTSISAEGLIKSLQAVVEDNIFVMDSRIWPMGAMSLVETASTLCDEDRESGRLPAMRGLSVREIEILRRIVEGDSNKHIARRLDIAEATVKAHVKTVMRKISVSNRTQAAIWAMNHGLAQDEDKSAVEETTAAADQVISDTRMLLQ
jgi:two-component system, NarL family, nitrate/nitrite response regulator NarL